MQHVMKPAATSLLTSKASTIERVATRLSDISARSRRRGLICQSAPKFDPPYCLTWGCYFRLTDVGPTVGRSEVASLLAGSEGLETSRSAHHTQRRPRSRDRRPVPHPQPCAG